MREEDRDRLETMLGGADSSDAYWGAAVGCASALAFVLNLTALVLFCTRPGLKTLANRFVMNLLAVNLCCSLMLGPLFVADRLRLMEGGSPWCGLCEGAAAFCCVACALGASLVVSDQYLAVTDPLRYRTRVSRARSLAVIGAQWLVSGVVGVLAGAAPPPGAGAWRSCRFDPAPDPAAWRRVYESIFSGAYFSAVVLCLLLVCLMYWRISSAARKSARPPAPPPPLQLVVDEQRVGLLEAPKATAYELLLDGDRLGGLKPTGGDEKRVQSHDDIRKLDAIGAPVGGGMKTVRSSPNFCAMETGASGGAATPPPPRSASSSYMSSLRCRISNASLFRYREESRAARVSAVVVVVALLTQVPASLTRLCPVLGALPALALCLGACVSPFPFVYRSRRVQKELASLCCGRGRSEGEGPQPAPTPLRRTSSLSTERSWRGAKTNSSQAALRLLRALAVTTSRDEDESCPKTKSILKRVRWGIRRCRASGDQPRCEIAAVHVQRPGV